MIIGLCGAARSGKDTVANYLAEGHDQVVRIQIAEPLKAYVRDLFDWTEEHTDGALKDTPDQRYPKAGVHVWIRSFNDGSWFECGCGIRVHASDTVPPGECTTYLTPRHAMQQLGGEFAESTWNSIYAVRAARTAAEWDGLAIITDCRFLRDIQAVKDVGGIIVEVTRPLADALPGSGSKHASETARDTPEFQALVDYWIDNDGTLEELHTKVVVITEPSAFVPGCWVESRRFGKAVLISVEVDHVVLRYKAKHLATGKDIWVLTRDGTCGYLNPPDDFSREVLAKTGTFGMGEHFDPRIEDERERWKQELRDKE